MIWRYHCLIFQGSPPKCFLSGGYILFRFLFLFTFWFLLLSFLCNIGRFPYRIKFVVGFIFHLNSYFWWSCSCLSSFFMLFVCFLSSRCEVCTVQTQKMTSIIIIKNKKKTKFVRNEPNLMVEDDLK